jgi:predicted nucleic acid-binding protein
VIGGHLVDSSALWFLFREGSRALEALHEHIATGALRICEATRTEFLYSATSASDRDLLIEDLDLIVQPVPVPKQAWRWVETAQYKLTQRGLHRSAGPIDLLVCATAVHHDLTVLHVDNDFRTVASVMSELRERDARPLA